MKFSSKTSRCDFGFDFRCRRALMLITIGFSMKFGRSIPMPEFILGFCFGPQSLSLIYSIKFYLFYSFRCRKFFFFFYNLVLCSLEFVDHVLCFNCSQPLILVNFFFFFLFFPGIVNQLTITASLT